MLVDRLSRSLTTTVMDRKLLASFVLPDLPDSLVSWMEDPSEDWVLPNRILAHVMSMV